MEEGWGRTLSARAPRWPLFQQEGHRPVRGLELEGSLQKSGGPRAAPHCLSVRNTKVQRGLLAAQIS